jgi:hypothetical protein
MPNQIVAIAPYWFEELGAWVFSWSVCRVVQPGCTWGGKWDKAISTIEGPGIVGELTPIPRFLRR